MCPVAWAYPETHPPFPAGQPVPYPTLKAEPVIDYDQPAEFTEDDVRIETARVSGK